MQPDPAVDANHPPFHFLVHAVPIKVACEILARGRSRIFELLGLGKLKGVKDGTRTLITVESIRTYQASMPPAVIKAPPPPRLENLERLHERQRLRAKRRADRRRRVRATG